MAKEFPVKIKHVPSYDWIVRNESAELPLVSTHTNAGILNPIANNTGANWRTATKATITANTWVSAANPIVSADAGRRYVIRQVVVETTDDCEVAIVKRVSTFTAPNGVGGSSVLLERMIHVAASSIKDISGGRAIFNFDNLVLRPSEYLDFRYSRNSTTGTNWLVSVTDGYSLTNDENYQAPYKIAAIGDSIAYGASSIGSPDYTEREDGTINGLWPFIIKHKLAKAGINTRLVNMGIGGTDSKQWDYWTSNGKLDVVKDADLLFINLGMNDASIDSGLTGGVFKRNIKGIIRRYFTMNPAGSCIVNQITDTDEALRNANTTAGGYNTTRLFAYRTELESAVSEFKAANPQFDLQLAATDTAFVKTQADHYSETESAGNRVHPNTTLGYPAMAVKIWEKVLISQFYTKAA